MSEHETTATDSSTDSTNDSIGADGDAALSDEAFIRRFKSKVPADVAESYDAHQFEAIAAVFGARHWRRHAIDRRLVFPLFGRNFYVVALAGGERRSPTRRLSDRLLHPVATIGNAAFALVFFIAILFSLFAVLYVLKSFLGINLMPNTSLGIMPTIKEQFDLLFP